MPCEKGYGKMKYKGKMKRQAEKALHKAVVATKTALNKEKKARVKYMKLK